MPSTAFRDYADPNDLRAMQALVQARWRGVTCVTDRQRRSILGHAAGTGG